MLFVEIDIHGSVGGDLFGISVGGEDGLAGESAGQGELGWGDGETVGDGCSLGGDKAWVDDEGDGAGEGIVLPDVGRNDGDAAAGVDLQVVDDLPGGLDAGAPTLPIGLVTGLGIDDILLNTVDAVKAAGAVGALDEGGVNFPANAVVEGEAWGELPGVL